MVAALLSLLLACQTMTGCTGVGKEQQKEERYIAVICKGSQPSVLEDSGAGCKGCRRGAWSKDFF